MERWTEGMLGRGRPLQEMISSEYEYSGYVNMWLRQIWHECNDEGSYAEEQTGGGFMMKGSVQQKEA